MARKSINESGEVESLTSSLIDGLYKQIRTNEIIVKKQEQSKANYVSSKKQILTYKKKTKQTNSSIKKGQVESKIKSLSQ